MSQEPSPAEDRAVARPDQADVSTVYPPTASSPGLPLAPGPRLTRYRILAELGRGGMGVVYRAHDTQLNRDVALKAVRTDLAGTTERFLREARAMAAVRHDHVVEVYDFGEENGIRFLAMPLLPGETLAARLRRQGPLAPSEVVRIGRELAEGLAAVHEKRLIHRDLKPSNIWLEAPHGRVKLLDFGLARDPRGDDGVTSPGSLIGTPAYMSPEQVNGLALDARSDLFSLGSVLYEMATGRPAFLGPTQTATLQAVGEKVPPPARTVNAAVPAGLSDLIERLHRKRTDDRPASAAEVAKELTRLAPGPEAPTAATTAVGAEDRRRAGWWGGPLLPAACACGLIVLILIGAIVAYSVTSRPRDTGRRPNDAPSPPAVAEPLRVRALDVHHFEGIDAGKSRARGVIGKESFGATPDDDVKVTARLSRPAYCYLIVFRPDGKEEVLYPQGADLTPEKTEEPRYPSKDRSKVYGLSDGTGLWLVALVASDQPLPPYAQWRRDHPGGPWKPSAGEADLVWLDDGNWLEAVTAAGVQNRGTRGEKQAPGTSPVVNVVDWLKAETGGAVSAVGFTVEAMK
ncbi:MAG TPA: protein kinase [Gemmataceae bacterium]|nr:protein kinase [Gemmataceae bacterium]